MRGPGLEPTNYAAYGGRRHWDRLRRRVYERDGYRCQRCLRRSGPDGGYEFAIHAHHVVPLSRGGPNSLGNLVSLCPPCHGLQHPENPAFDGLRSHAPPLPAGADPRVAVARRVRVVAPGDLAMAGALVVGRVGSYRYAKRGFDGEEALGPPDRTVP